MIIRQLLNKLFKDCKKEESLTQLHCLTVKAGLVQDAFYASKLIDLYSKFAALRPVRQLFDETSHRTLYIWNCILKSYCGEKRFKESLCLLSYMRSCERWDAHAIHIALKACGALKALDFGKMVHGVVKKCDQISEDLFVGSGLVEMYSKCGETDDALSVFEEYTEPDGVLWTTMITGYGRNGKFERALDGFARMVATEGVEVDDVALISVISACARMFNLNMGRSIHGYAIKLGLERGQSLSNALVNLYQKAGRVDAAANLFESMENKDVITWGSMITCYAHHGYAGEALKHFNEMVASGVELNTVSVISALQACEATLNLEFGRRIHTLAASKGLDVNILVSTALIDMFMICRAPEEALQVFERMPEKDAVSFSALIHGCVENGLMHKAIDVFREKLANAIHSGALDLVKVITACSDLGVLQHACCFHCFVVRAGLEKNPFIAASLIEAYAKCGDLDHSIAVFKETKLEADIVIWSSMIAAYGVHGRGKEALELFHYMTKQSAEIRPNEVSFLSILSACSHAGLVKEGIATFTMMVKDYRISPNPKHLSIVVDLLARIGELDKAFEFVSQMPEKTGENVWAALLGACKTYRNTAMGEAAADKLIELGSRHAGHYMLLRNVYAVGEKWDKVAEVRNVVKEKQLKKVAARSTIELRNEVTSFVVNDRSHRDSELIFEMLRKLHRAVKLEPKLCGIDLLLLQE